MVGERLLTVAQAAQVLHLSVAGTYGTIAEIKAVFGFGRHNTRTRTSAIPTSVGRRALPRSSERRFFATNVAWCYRRGVGSLLFLPAACVRDLVWWQRAASTAPVTPTVWVTADHLRERHAGLCLDAIAGVGDGAPTGDPVGAARPAASDLGGRPAPPTPRIRDQMTRISK